MCMCVFARNVSKLRATSSRRGRADLLRVVPSVTDDPRRGTQRAFVCSVLAVMAIWTTLHCLSNLSPKRSALEGELNMLAQTGLAKQACVYLRGSDAGTHGSEFKHA